MADNAKKADNKSLDALKGQEIKGGKIKGGIAVKFDGGGCGNNSGNSTPGGG